MAATSREVRASVREKAFENPHNRPNIILGHELPENIHRETYYIIQKEDSLLQVIYVSDTLKRTEVKIRDVMPFLEDLNSLLKEKKEARLSTEELAGLMRQHSLTSILDSDELARQFAMETIYHGEPVIYQGTNSDIYLNQIKQLLDYYKKELIPCYFKSQDQPDALKDIESFYNKVAREILTQSTEVMQTLQTTLAFNAYVFSQKDEKQFGSKFRHLCEQMGHCGPGSITSVILQASELKGLISKSIELSNWLTQLRKTTFDRLIQQHREDKNVSVGMDVHLRPAFFNMATKLGFNVEDEDEKALSGLNDSFVSDTSLGIDDSTEGWVYDYFHAQYHRTAIIDYVTNEFLSRCPHYQFDQSIAENQRYILLSDDIQDGFLKSLFNLKHHPMTITRFLIPGTDKRRRDFPRNLRGYVEQLLIEEGYISPARNMLMTLESSDDGIKINLSAQEASPVELEDVLDDIKRVLGKISGLTLIGDETGLRFQCDNPANYYTALLCLGDIQKEFDIEQNSLLSMINSLKTASMFNEEQANFLLKRLNTSIRIDTKIPKDQFGINPCYVIDDETQACQLLEWDADTDYRDPDFFNLARHVSGQSVLEWALNEKKNVFLTELILTKAFDPGFDPTYEETISISNQDKDRVIDCVFEQFNEIVANLVKRNEFNKILQLMSRVPKLDENCLNQLMALLVDSGMKADAHSSMRIRLLTDLAKRGATLAGSGIAMEKYLHFILGNMQSNPTEVGTAFDLMELEKLSVAEKKRVIAVLNENAFDPSIQSFLKYDVIVRFRTRFIESNVIDALSGNDVDAALMQIISLYSPLNFNTLPEDTLSQVINKVSEIFWQTKGYVQWVSLLILKLAPIAFQRGHQSLYEYLMNLATRLLDNPALEEEQRLSLQLFISTANHVLDRFVLNQVGQSEQQVPRVPTSSSKNIEQEVRTSTSQPLRHMQTSCPYIDWQAFVSRDLRIDELVARNTYKLKQKKIISNAESNELTGKKDTELYRELTRLLASPDLTNQLSVYELQILKEDSDVLLKLILADHFIPIDPIKTLKLKNSATESIQAMVVMRLRSLAKAILALNMNLTPQLMEYLEIVQNNPIKLFNEAPEAYHLLFQKITDAISQTMMMEAPLTEDKKRYFERLLITIQTSARFANQYLMPCQLPTLNPMNLTDELVQFKNFLVTEIKEEKLIARMRQEELAQLSLHVPLADLCSYYSRKVGLSVNKEVLSSLAAHYNEKLIESHPILQKEYARYEIRQRELQQKIDLMQDREPKIEGLYMIIKSLFSRYARSQTEEEKLLIKDQFKTDFPAYAEHFDRLFAEHELGMENSIKGAIKSSLDKIDLKITGWDKNKQGSSVLLSAKISFNRFFKKDSLNAGLFTYGEYRDIKNALLFLQKNKSTLAPELPNFKVKFQRSSNNDYSKPAEIRMVLIGDTAEDDHDKLIAELKKWNIDIVVNPVNGRIYMKNGQNVNGSSIMQHLEQSQLASQPSSSQTSSSGSSGKAISYVQSPILNASILPEVTQRLLNGEITIPSQPQTMHNFDCVSKIHVSGSSSSGKTCLIHRYLDDIFKENIVYQMDKSRARAVSMANNKSKLMISEKKSIEELDRRLACHEPDPQGRIYCIDPTVKGSLEAFRKTYNKRATIPGIVAFTKRDNEHNYQYTDEQLEEFCKQEGMVGLFTSAKTSEGIEDLFHLMNGMILAQRYETEIQNTSKETVEVVNEKSSFFDRFRW